MITTVLSLLLLSITWVELILLTLVLYGMTFLPVRLLTKLNYPTVFRFWCWLFTKALNVDLRLHQKNTYPIPEKYILIANHPSAFEDVGIPSLFPVTCLAKEEVKSWFMVGRINIAAGTLFVKRNDSSSRRQVIKDMINEIYKGNNIALYPEGGCFGRRIQPSFKNGAFLVSYQTGIPILPIFLHYEMQDVFEWRDPQTLIQKMWHFITSQNNSVNYYLYDAIDPKQFNTIEEYNHHVHSLYVTWQEKYLN